MSSPTMSEFTRFNDNCNDDNKKDDDLWSAYAYWKRLRKTKTNKKQNNVLSNNI